jgi:hypothetical protein
MLAELDAARAAEQQLSQLILPPLEGERPQIDAVELQEVEGVEECDPVMLAAGEELEIRDAHRVAHHGLAVDRRVCAGASMASRIKG